MKNDFLTLVHMLKQLNYIMNKKQKINCISIFFMIIIGAGFEAIGISAIFPFIQALLNPRELYDKWYLKPVLSFFNITDELTVVIILGLFIIAIYIIKNIYLLISSYFQVKFRCKLEKELSVQMMSSYVNRPFTYFLTTNSSEVLRGVGIDVDGIYVILDDIFKLLAEGLTIIFIGIYIISADILMALGTFFFALISFFIITLIIKKKLKGMGERQRNAQKIQYEHAYQMMGGIKEIKVMNRTQNFIEQYEAAYEEKRKTSVVFKFLSACPERIIEAVCISGLISVVVIRVMLGVDVEKFIPDLAVFAVAAFRILPSVSKLTSYISSLIFYRPALLSAYNNVKEVRKYEKFINERFSRNIIPHNKYIKFYKLLEIKDIVWKYADGNKTVLNKLSLSINKGETVAFIGSSGAGKTTLANIILGLLMPQSGQILVDGKNIWEIPYDWSKMIGYVPQVVFLLDDTIRNNIFFGINNKERNDCKIWDVLEKVQLKKFVQELPMGLDTFVGEGGVRFSGGQRQRVAIARALYNDPDILILDEATSALDNETENAVMESIDALHGYKTLIIVAHRLTTLKNSDKIFEIKDGHAYIVDKKQILS